MTRAAFVCQWYPPEPVAIPESIAHALQDEGIEVEVLTGVPNYPTGKLVAGYSAIRPMSETIAGVRVHRVPLYPSHDSRASKRLLNYASWALSCAFLGQRRLRRSDVTLVYSSPALAALPAMVARSLWKTPYVLLVQDVWPDSVFASGFLNGPAARVVRSLIDVFVRRSYARAAHIVVTSPGMKTLLTDRDVPAQKISIVYNWLPEAETSAPVLSDRSMLRRRVGLPEDACVFLYAGNHGKAQDLAPVVEAFASTSYGRSHLVLMGDGIEKRALESRARHYDRVHLLEPVSRSEAAALARSADFNVVSLAGEPLFAVTMPSKVQSALAAGSPLLVVARGDAAAVVQESGAGMGAQPGSVSDIRRAIAHLENAAAHERAAMGAAGKNLYESTMARPVGAPALAAVLRNAARSHASRSAATVCSELVEERNEL